MIVEPTEAELSVVVPVYGHAADTLACLASIDGASERLRVIVVDDASPDGTAARVEQESPGVRLLRNSANLGFAGCVNVGLRAALAEGAKAVLVLNSDACLMPDTVSGLQAALSEGVAAAGAVPLDASEPHYPQYAGSRDPNWWKLTFRQTLPLKTPFATDLEEVDAACGCALLFAADALEELGLLEEAFYCYHEEIDWCLRARRAGWRIRVATTAHVLHRGQASGGSAFARYYGIRNQALLIRRQGPTALHRGVALVWWAGRVLILEAGKRHRSPGGAAIALRALWHGATGRTGRVAL